MSVIDGSTTNGGIAPISQPVRCLAIAGETSEAFLPPTLSATFRKSIFRLPGRMARTSVSGQFLDLAEHGLGALAGIIAANSSDSLGGAFRGVVNDAKTGFRVL